MREAVWKATVSAPSIRSSSSPRQKLDVVTLDELGWVLTQNLDGLLQALQTFGLVGPDEALEQPRSLLGADVYRVEVDPRRLTIEG